MGKHITITITKNYFAPQYLSFLLRLTPASFPVLGELGCDVTGQFVWAIGFGSKPPRLFGQRELASGQEIRATGRDLFAVQ